MIAVSSHEIAGETANDASENDSTTEASPRNARANTSHSRHPGTVSNLFARAATSTDSAIQSGEDMESNADGHRNDNGQGTNPNLSAALTGRASRHLGSTDSIAPTPQNQTTALSGTGNESPAQIGAVARDMVTNAVNVAAMSSREGSGTRTAPTGITINTGDVSMLNPPRLPTQSGAVLPPFTIPAGAGQRAWAEEIGNRVMWILGRAENRAELILTPPHLGKVEVSIHLNGDQGTAQFLASSQSAREALEQAMPRLRELLAQAGISLGETHVNTSAEGRAQDGENTSRMGMRASDIRDDDGDGNATAIVTTNEPRLNNGLVDVFA
jgi:flagellar hook-length control protein FliK